MEQEPLPPTTPAKQNRFKRLISRYWAKKRLTLPLTILLIIGVVLAVPATRYPVLGLFLQRDFQILVVDSSSQKPVTRASVTLAGVSAQTNEKGVAVLHVPVGSQSLSVSKKYFRSAARTVLVPLRAGHAPHAIAITATGRQVPVSVINKVTHKPLAGAVLAAAGSEVKTDAGGKAVIVLPADKKTADVKITSSGYNDTSGTITVTEQAVAGNTFAVTPTGTIYFLSRLSGKIDVVRTNLDGSDRRTVLAGTGREDNRDTILLASRDWKYLALKSKRDGGENAKLFLIDTATDKQTTIDEGNAYFLPVGWSDHRFVYTVSRIGVENWQPKAQAIKSFDATSGKMTIVDESDAEGTGQSDFAFTLYGQVYIMENELAFVKDWNASYSSAGRLSGKQVSLVSVRADGSAKRSVRDFPVPAGQSYYAVFLNLYEPHALYIQVRAVGAGEKPTYYEYEDGKIEQKSDVTDQEFNDPYNTYLVSPSGKKTFWSEQRDGKSVLFVGDSHGKNGQQVGSLADHNTYGWYGDDYLLVSKNASELYIMPVGGGDLLKITDYHKPNYDFQGYGYGYGGL